MMLILYDAADLSILSLFKQLDSHSIPYHAIDFKSFIQEWLVCVLPSGKHFWRHHACVVDPESASVIYHQMHRLSLLHVQAFPAADRVYALESWRAYLHAFLIKQSYVINPIMRQSLFSPKLWTPGLYRRARAFGFHTPTYIWSHQKHLVDQMPDHWRHEPHTCLGLGRVDQPLSKDLVLIYPPSDDYILDIFANHGIQRYAPPADCAKREIVLPLEWKKRLLALAASFNLIWVMCFVKLPKSGGTPYLYAIDNQPFWPNQDCEAFWHHVIRIIKSRCCLLRPITIRQEKSAGYSHAFIPKHLRPFSDQKTCSIHKGSAKGRV
jgi:hypothetical protein